MPKPGVRDWLFWTSVLSCGTTLGMLGYYCAIYVLAYVLAYLSVLLKGPF